MNCRHGGTTRPWAADTTKAEKAGVLCVSRFDELSSMLKNGPLRPPDPPVAVHGLLRLFGLGALARAAETGFLSGLEPPEHTRLKKIIDPFFYKSSVNRLEPWIESIAEQLLDEVDGKKEFDAVSDFATRFPALVMARVFGFPESDHVAMSRWAHRISPLADQELRPSTFVLGLMASVQFRKRVLRLVHERKDDPKDDLLSALAEAHYKDDGITSDQVAGLAILVLTAGQITVTHLVASCILLLLQSPSVHADLKKRPEAIAPFVEEALRLYSPFQRLPRVLTEDVVANGKAFPRGSPVRLMVGLANRDQERFERPDDVDLNRRDPRHLAFGAGRHFCLGLHLGRLEANVAVRSVLRRFPDLSLVDEEVTWRPGTKFLGLSKLRVRAGR